MSIRTRLTAIALGVVAAICVDAPAFGWTQPIKPLVAGPQLTGTGTAWAEAPADGPIEVKLASVDGTPATLHTIARSDFCIRVSDLAAVEQRVGLLVFRGHIEGGRCYQDGVDTVAVTPGSPAQVVETSPGGFSYCFPSAIDLEGSVMAVARFNCQEHAVQLHDLATGTTTELGALLPNGTNPAAVRTLGRYVALLLENFGGPYGPISVMVWDRQESKQLYQVSLAPLLGPNPQTGIDIRLALQADGTTVIGGLDSANIPRWAYGWISAAEPTVHRIPGDFDQIDGRISLNGGLVTLPMREPAGLGVFALDGALRNRFATTPPGGTIGIGFDGQRLAWGELGKLHNEAFPFEPPPPAPPAPPPPPVTPKPATPAPRVPAAVLAKLGSTLASKKLKSFKGTASDADGDLAAIRIGLVRIKGKRCETLQPSGKLKTSPRVGGKCVPTKLLAATGTASWHFKLRRALPPGRYAVYAQAVDAAGHTQTAFATATGNLRTFRLR